MTATFRIPKRSKYAASEADIERACTDFLALDGWRSLKTDPVRNREWGKGFGELGMADRLYLRYWAGYRADAVKDIGGIPDLLTEAQVLWIEWKRFQVKPKPHQIAWHAKERARGALTLIAGVDFTASIEGFMLWYKASGLNRRIAA